MKKKVVWVVVSCLMALSLLLASCAPAVTEEEEKAAPPPKVEKEVITEEEVAPPPEGPIYGGVIRHCLGRGIRGFDPGFAPLSIALLLTNEELLTGDWAKGPAGTGEVSWMGGGFMMEVLTECLAESWEIPEAGTIIYHIRQGVHWHDKPPVNGRELTAEDVAFSFNYLLKKPGSFLCDHHDPKDVYSVEATDRWTVVIKCRPEVTQPLFADFSDGAPIIPHEVVEQYGDMNDWENVCGTGPFTIVDFVPDSSATFIKNPNYWRKDPAHPENTLPYADGIDCLVVPDRSTQQAALRTGKIITLSQLAFEERDIFLKTSPHLLWTKQPSSQPRVISLRIDVPPFDDIRVRQALAMAIDRQKIAKEFYGGNAEIYCWPVSPDKDFSDLYTPLEELPESIREMYEYKPDKARQLLAEAGYPKGFKTSMVCTSADVDALSIIKEYWADIGVELDLDVKESGMMKSVIDSRAYKTCYSKSVTMRPQTLRDAKIGSIANRANVSDPYVEELYYRVAEKLLEPESNRLVKEEYVPYLLEHCWQIQYPTPDWYVFWQPWLKGYHGEGSVGTANSNNWLIYVWLDQKLKKEMGY